MSLNPSDLVNDQMSLATDAVNGDTAGLQTVDEIKEGVYFCTRAVEVVIVDVELCRGISSASCFEGKVYELFSKYTVENGVTE